MLVYQGMKFSFPSSINETSARIVAAGVTLLAIVTLATKQHWITAVLLYGFTARVLWGPKFSPLALLATKVITPRIPVDHKIVPGAPKRFAQGMGLTVSTIAFTGFLLGSPAITTFALVALIFAASLEAIFGFCLGCVTFGWLMRFGAIPERICVECADLSLRYAKVEQK